MWYIVLEDLVDLRSDTLSRPLPVKHFLRLQPLSLLLPGIRITSREEEEAGIDGVCERSRCFLWFPVKSQAFQTRLPNGARWKGKGGPDEDDINNEKKMLEGEVEKWCKRSRRRRRRVNLDVLCQPSLGLRAQVTDGSHRPFKHGREKMYTHTHTLSNKKKSLMVATHPLHCCFSCILLLCTLYICTARDLALMVATNP